MRLAFALALTVVLSACGTPQTAEQACSALAAARCTRLGICSPDFMLTTYGDDATCQARELLGCLSRLNAPGTAATPIFLEGCALAVPRSSCRSFLTNALPQACIAPPGRLSDGAACFDDAQCQSGTCNRATLYRCGTCGAPAGAGEPCTARSCARGLLCLHSTTCVRPAAIGDPCDDETPCQVGGTCVGATPDMQGSCSEAVSMAGSACDPTGALRSDCNRASKLYCQASPDGGTCQSVIYLDAGRACNDADASSACSAGARCEGTCVAPAADGARCDAAPCLAPAACIAGLCALPGAC